ncbi:hypothetical protein F5I97DRAFT_472558 [Phlebopus sp. FC_14]|nr:hypothetical protein F5I97DRAFT_472558 [Phlebopus sp. FC_14]
MNNSVRVGYVMSFEDTGDHQRRCSRVWMHKPTDNQEKPSCAFRCLRWQRRWLLVFPTEPKETVSTRSTYDAVTDTLSFVCGWRYICLSLFVPDGARAMAAPPNRCLAVLLPSSPGLLLPKSPHFYHLESADPLYRTEPCIPLLKPCIFAENEPKNRGHIGDFQSSDRTVVMEVPRQECPFFDVFSLLNFVNQLHSDPPGNLRNVTLPVTMSHV